MKILICDYMGYGKEDGAPVGHVLKVLRESAQVLSKSAEIKYCVTHNYAGDVSADTAVNVSKLPYYVKVGARDTTLGNIRRMLGSFRNIRQILKEECDVLWFCNVDQFLYMYLGMFGRMERLLKKGRRVIITTFATAYPKAYHNYFASKVLDKTTLVITTNPEAKIDSDNKLYMPDYLYSEEKYQPYQKVTKEDKCVCLGTMNSSKHIYELVEGFSKLKYPLEICGYFYDKEYLGRINSLLSSYPEEVRSLIRIKDGYISEEEYLSKLGEAKYVVLPYDSEAYKATTSGVLLEAAFVGTMPIAPKLLLDRMGMQGIDMDELKKHLGNEDYLKECVEKNNQIVKNRYSKDIYASRIQEAIQ